MKAKKMSKRMKGLLDDFSKYAVKWGSFQPSLGYRESGSAEEQYSKAREALEKAILDLEKRAINKVFVVHTKQGVGEVCATEKIAQREELKTSKELQKRGLYAGSILYERKIKRK